MKIKFDVVKGENFDFILLKTKLLKTFKEVDNVAIVENVEGYTFYFALLIRTSIY